MTSHQHPRWRFRQARWSEIRTWDAPCYEFAHFTDDELAGGIMAVHHTIDGWSRDELVAALRYWRDKGQEIKRVWMSGR